VHRKGIERNWIIPCGGLLSRSALRHLLILEQVNSNDIIAAAVPSRGNPFDALIVGYYDGDRLLYAVKVRNGFVPQVRREVASRFKGLQIDTCPFANLPERKRTQWALTKEEMKNCVWLKPELVAQIEFTEWTPDGHSED
jgi:ATP-dependent DNA ligase